MSHGIRIRDTANRITFDSTSYSVRILGVIVSPAATGSVSDARFSEGRPFAVIYNSSLTAGVLRHNQMNAVDVFSWVGNTMSWSIGASASTRRIVYGVR